MHNNATPLAVSISIFHTLSRWLFFLLWQINAHADMQVFNTSKSLFQSVFMAGIILIWSGCWKLFQLSQLCETLKVRGRSVCRLVVNAPWQRCDESLSVLTLFVSSSFLPLMINKPPRFHNTVWLLFAFYINSLEITAGTDLLPYLPTLQQTTMRGKEVRGHRDVDAIFLSVLVQISHFF